MTLSQLRNLMDGIRQTTDLDPDLKLPPTTAGVFALLSDIRDRSKARRKWLERNLPRREET